MTKKAGSGAGSVSQRHGSADPDPYENVTDPNNQQWFNLMFNNGACYRCTTKDEIRL